LPIGNKGFGFMNRIGAKVKSHLTGLGDTPHMEKLIGAVKVMLDSYVAGEIDAIYLSYNHFINTMRQEPRMEQLFPLAGEQLGAAMGTGTISTNRMQRR
jgi:F-type H+-transporting ATPase subunit gamma